MTEREFDLLVVGELNPDLVISGDDVTPAFGQAEKMVSGAALTVGSSSAIVACGAARLGLRVAFIGVVGDDLFGRFMLDELRVRGVDTSGCVVRRGEPTGVSVILSQPHDRAILTHPGTIAALRYEDIDRGFLKRSARLHVSSYFLLDGLRPDLPRLFEEAKALGLGTSLDTNWDPRGEWNAGIAETLAHVDVLIPNEAEALHLSGSDNFETALDALAAQVEMLAVKLGPHGGLLRHAGETHRAPALAVDPLDTTGAGDSFDAGLIYGLASGQPPARALAIAVACGSLSTRALGGVEAQATAVEVSAALAGGQHE